MRLSLALSATLLAVGLSLSEAASAADEDQPSQAPRAPAAKPRASDTLKPPKKGNASPITDRFALRVLYWPADISTDMRLDPRTGDPGTELSAEDDLGMPDSKSEGRAEMTIRLREKNRLRVDYMKLSRFGDKVLDQQIVFGNRTFNINDRAQTQLEWRQLTFTYTRSLLYRDRFEAGLGLGVSLIEARARGEVTARNIRERQEAVGAFPTIAVDAAWRISKRWSLTARAQRFQAHVNEFRGSLADYHGDVQWRWHENLALGLGWTRMHSLVDVGKDNAQPGDLTGRFDQSTRGPELFLRASF
ncbi:MAG TPA: hypothetical protein VG994_12180 [Steroidobacteraceae bacterium]|nr:hypothetical protein [Steroidobacteraceae bacterium]